jgi:hypothetical protein
MIAVLISLVVLDPRVVKGVLLVLLIVPADTIIKSHPVYKAPCPSEFNRDQFFIILDPSCYLLMWSDMLSFCLEATPFQGKQWMFRLSWVCSSTVNRASFFWSVAYRLPKANSSWPIVLGAVLELHRWSKQNLETVTESHPRVLCPPSNWVTTNLHKS